MRAVQYSADVYVNLDAVLAFRVEPDESHPPKLKLWLPDGKELSVFEPYASVILTLLLPPALPVGPAPKCWAKQDINGHESLCTLPKGHPGPCRYESPGASPALPMRPR